MVASKLAALRAIHEAQPFGEDGWSEDAFSGFVERGGESLRRYALFEALSLHHSREGHGAGWRGWPEAFQDFGSPEVRAFAEANADETRFLSWLQWVTATQLDAASEAAREAGMRIGLYLDLAVGESPDGAASWGSDVILSGLSVGAPPDMFAADGQDWGLAAPNPQRLAGDPTPFRDMIAAQLRHAGALRIDHAMALRQLFLIPEGRPAKEGAYVRFPSDAMLSVIAEESQRHQAVVIGEDLGTVPEGFSEEMNDAGILSYRILYFEWDGRAFTPLDEWPETALACLSTHDLPTFADWWAGDDVGRRLEHGLVSEEDSAGFAKQRTQERRGLIKALRSEGLARRGWKAEGPAPEGLLAAVHRLLARTPSLLVAVRMSDLMGPTRPTNVPGTTDSYPNWRPRSSIAVDAVASVPDFRAVTAALAEARPRGPAR